MFNVHDKEACSWVYQQNDSQKHLCLLTLTQTYTRLQDLYSCAHTDKEEKMSAWSRDLAPWSTAEIGGWLLKHMPFQLSFKVDC